MPGKYCSLKIRQIDHNTTIDQNWLALECLDPLLASAGLDRLLDRAEVLIIRGPSFRAQGRSRLMEVERKDSLMD
jgi:hypothetical protein